MAYYRERRSDEGVEYNVKIVFVLQPSPLFQKLETSTVEELKKTFAGTFDDKVDIYSLGLILLELTTTIKTTHEKLNIFDLVKSKRKLPKNLENTIEG